MPVILETAACRPSYEEELFRILERTIPLINPDKALYQSYRYTTKGDSFAAALASLGQFMPETMSEGFYDEINGKLSVHLVDTRNRMTNVLDHSHMTFEEVKKKRERGQDIDLKVTTAIDDVQKYAWYLTLVNHRAVTTALNDSPSWNYVSKNDSPDVFLDALLHTQEHIARTYDPKIASVATYIYALFQFNRTAALHGKCKNLKQIDMRYLGFFDKATRIIEESGDAEIQASMNPYILASLIHDARGNRLTYRDPIEAYREYVTALHGDTPPVWNQIIWNTAGGNGKYENFRVSVHRFIARLKAVVAGDHAQSLDEWVLAPDVIENGQDDWAPFVENIQETMSGLRPVEDMATQRQMTEVVSSLFDFNVLSRREETVLKLRLGFYNDRIYTLAEITHAINPPLTEERIRQIERKALRKLRFSRPIVQSIRDFKEE